MKKVILSLTIAAMLGISMSSAVFAGDYPVSVETWASFNDNQKHLYAALEEIDEDITGVFEYQANLTMADGSKAIVDLLFVEAPEAEDGVYVYDTATGELYDHINQKKVAEEFETMEHCINTLANCYSNYAGGSEIMWTDSEIILPMSEDEIQAVFVALSEENTGTAEVTADAEAADAVVTTTEVQNTEEAAVSDSEASLIEFENVVLVDNETVTMELVNFYSEDVNWVDGPQNEKYFTVKVTNKTDHDILLNPDKFYLNNEECYRSMVQGSITPEAGRAGTYSFSVAYNTTPVHTALEALDLLYSLEGSFSGLHVYEDSSKNASLEVSFSISEALENAQ